MILVKKFWLKRNNIGFLPATATNRARSWIQTAYFPQRNPVQQILFEASFWVGGPFWFCGFAEWQMGQFFHICGTWLTEFAILLIISTTRLRFWTCITIGESLNSFALWAAASIPWPISSTLARVSSSSDTIFSEYFHSSFQQWIGPVRLHLESQVLASPCSLVW